MTRNKLIEVMAMSMAEARRFHWERTPLELRNRVLARASSTLSAIEAAGYAVVPIHPTDLQLLAMETGSSLATVYELALAHSPIRGK